MAYRKMKKERIKIVGGLFSLALSLYLSVCFFSYSKWDPSFFTYSPEPAKNLGGAFGSYLTDIMMTIFGVGSYPIVVFLFIYGLKGVLLKERQKINLIGSLLFVLSSSILAFLFGHSFGIEVEAGFVGRSLGRALSIVLSVIGAYIFGIALFLASVILLSPASFIQYIFMIGEKKEPKDIPKEPEPSYRVTEEGLLESLPPPTPSITEEQASEASLEPKEIEKELEYISKPEKKKTGGYELPSIELLSIHESDLGRQREPAADVSMLEKRLYDFGVQGKVVQVHVGPVVTMFEFEPASGIKINKIVSLSDDIALGLRAKSVRISPIPGRSTIGLEVPNKIREVVSLREIISSEGFKKSPSLLTLALGKDIFGNPVVADLTKMPHLLVAGSTGSGKSVALNSMVVSILYKAAPNEVKLLLIDPKLLELSVYDGIPHIISPVITNPKEASEALKRVVFEMDRRYRLLAECGTRNIESYNSIATEKMPYIVVIIDELADLMFASASEVEDSIARLAQMARASGIHLILATQRPSVDVITGVIKANFPARISFQVTSKIDSRTILDSQGAEQLIGKGDMLFMLPGSRTLRVHGALVTEAEINSITSFIKSQGSPDFSLLAPMPEEADEKILATDERDELYWKVVEFAESIGEVSISSIQRRFKIGYNKAARIMELMEEDGLVGPPRGAGKPRDFLRRK